MLTFKQRLASVIWWFGNGVAGLMVVGLIWGFMTNQTNNGAGFGLFFAICFWLIGSTLCYLLAGTFWKPPFSNSK